MPLVQNERKELGTWGTFTLLCQQASPWLAMPPQESFPGIIYNTSGRENSQGDQMVFSVSQILGILILGSYRTHLDVFFTAAS